MPFLKRNLEANLRSADAAKVRTAIVGNLSGITWPLLVGQSSVHAAADYSHMAQDSSFRADRAVSVEMTTLDAELSEESIDLLLLASNGFDGEILAGARRVLAAHQPRVIVAVTRTWTVFKDTLEAHGYVFEQQIPDGQHTWCMARVAK